MKKWHYIAIGGALLVGAWLFLRSRGPSAPAPAMGKGSATPAGSPALPNVNMANPTTGKLLAFLPEVSLSFPRTSYGLGRL